MESSLKTFLQDFKSRSLLFKVLEDFNKYKLNMFSIFDSLYNIVDFTFRILLLN